MRRKAAIPLLLLLLLVLISLAMKADAKSLKFPGTPVKQLTTAGDWGESQSAEWAGDPWKGSKYTKLSDELGVKVLDTPISPATKGIFGSADGVLSIPQLTELRKSDSPSVLRECVNLDYPLIYTAQGKPSLVQIAKRKFLICDFVRDRRFITAQGGCTPAFSYEAHAFTIDHAKMIHIYLTNSTVKEEMIEARQKAVSEQFHSMLQTMIWD